jgi:hypothetical protein
LNVMSGSSTCAANNASDSRRRCTGTSSTRRLAQGAEACPNRCLPAHMHWRNSRVRCSEAVVMYGSSVRFRQVAPRSPS